MKTPLKQSDIALKGHGCEVLLDAFAEGCDVVKDPTPGKVDISWSLL